jgi:hypothetical protein
MTNNHADEVPSNLHEQARAAEAGGGAGAGIASQAGLFGGRFALLMGGLIALYLLVVVYIYPRHIAWLTAVATVALIAGIFATARWHAAHRRASSLGWSKRYSLAFAISAGLFGAGIALLDMTDNREWWLWVPYAALTAVPLATFRLWPGAR